MKKGEFTEEELHLGREMIYAFKILFDKGCALNDLGDNTYLRNSIAELTHPTLGSVQIQLSFVKDKQEWMAEDGVNVTQYN